MRAAAVHACRGRVSCAAVHRGGVDEGSLGLAIAVDRVLTAACHVHNDKQPALSWARCCCCATVPWQRCNTSSSGCAASTIVASPWRGTACACHLGDAASLLESCTSAERWCLRASSSGASVRGGVCLFERSSGWSQVRRMGLALEGDTCCSNPYACVHQDSCHKTSSIQHFHAAHWHCATYTLQPVHRSAQP